ncbi:hypothetical protein D3C72_1967400 [compost metagenome]
MGAKAWVAASARPMMSASSQPPMAPSQDLPGLMDGASLRRPMALPVKYAPISAAHTSTAAVSSTPMPAPRRIMVAWAKAGSITSPSTAPRAVNDGVADRTPRASSTTAMPQHTTAASSSQVVAWRSGRSCQAMAAIRHASA